MKCHYKNSLYYISYRRDMYTYKSMNALNVYCTWSVMSWLLCLRQLWVAKVGDDFRKHAVA